MRQTLRFEQECKLQLDVLPRVIHKVVDAFRGGFASVDLVRGTLRSAVFYRIYEERE
ncbi:MAG: hypothetical protein ACREC6_03075 [Hyphomicrobiaceae bacterium]